MIRIFSLLLTLCFAALSTRAQEIDSKTFAGLKFRSIGPALTSGRIADIAMHPDNENVWYVAVGSGGVWKTVNSGTTWTPIFDGQDSYSIGCITLDPNNAETIWVGTGENVGGRHTGFGDGIYVSYDGGKTWKNKGLKASEHLSKIIVHPTNPDVLWVASQGPLWSKGGERGLYKSTDGGESWRKTLGDNEWVGATDIIIDPRNPDILYAATWERHRTVAALMGGGPGSGIHKSTDGGETWTKLSSGLPKTAMGKIGLAISPFNPDQIYAVVEELRRKGGTYMSANQGATWTKMSDQISGGTGPHYYQELYASPHQEGRLYLMNNVVMISDDHGKTFKAMNEKKKHVDSHAMAFKKSDPNYVLFGTDGGLYESFDLTKTWKYISNLPVVQYYKVAVDDSAPFYNVYGGTQDNGSHGGPSRTANQAGIRNADWWITLGADGHQSAVEPGNPDITYGEFQQGWLWRIDQTTGETVFIQPQPKAGDPHERFNWDAPILVSPHNPTRLYFASYRVWKSENRGDDWTAISGDLTRNEERLSLPIMGRTQSYDNAWDVLAMSNYNTITSLAESPLQEGLIYAGTDDGILQVTENGGESWRKIELGSIKGIPSTPFVNDVRADLHDANTVYLILDNHKYGDYKPYVLKSTDKGNSWTIINGDLPEKLLTWRIVQDHVKKDLLFLATEFGVYFSNDGGSKWIELTGGLPTISFRDITIQRRENDLVGATFGRGFYILDDITPLRDWNNAMQNAEATVFKTKPAHWYVPRQEIYGQGNADYQAKNPPYGAVFTYYLKDQYKSLADTRKETEKDLNKNKSNIPFRGWEALDKELTQNKPMIILTIRDAQGNVVKHVTGTNTKGFNRVAWDLSYAKRSGEKLKPKKGGGFFFGGGLKATPGTYTMTLSKVIDGVWTELSAPQEFEVIKLRDGALPAKNYADINAFRSRFVDFQQELTAVNTVLSQSQSLVDAMSRALSGATNPTPALAKSIEDTRNALLALDRTMNGSKARNEIGERNPPSPGDGQFVGIVSLVSSTYGPTGNHIAAFDRAVAQLGEVKSELKTISEETLPNLRSALKEAGAPWIEGEGLR